ncbi:MAG TPA: sigma-54 dependent transcriptional regulator [Polyangia bacterium]|nr:sigma-54 dependent transcriptional regulator [Polyangia bacterium]
MSKSKGRILVIDDALEMANAVVEYLRRNDFEAEAADSGQAGIARFRATPADAVLTDLRMKGVDGLDVLQAIHEVDAEAPVVIMTAFGAVESAVEAIQRGAYHYVTKPFKLEVVRVLLERAIGERSIRTENVALRRAVREAIPGGSLVGRTSAMRAVNELIRRVAPTSTPVLVLGETGTGKELVARDIHAEGPRRDAPFVAVNCAAVPEALLESELFGHVRGSFTGATQTRRGLFVEANGGTLFLDEIGEMPFALQAKLLRVLETGEVRSVGSDGSRKTDVRIVAATHRDVVAEIRAGRFRQDLYFRLNVVPIAIPPLRERKDDIPLLIEHFLQKSRLRLPTVPSRSFTPEALGLLINYAWPGNVRQLENAIDRWLITGDGAEIGVAEVRSLVAEWNTPDLPVVSAEMLPLQVVEERYIAWVMEKVGGNKTRASEILQIDPSTIYRRGKHRKA